MVVHVDPLLPFFGCASHCKEMNATVETNYGRISGFSQGGLPPIQRLCSTTSSSSWLHNLWRRLLHNAPRCLHSAGALRGPTQVLD